MSPYLNVLKGGCALETLELGPRLRAIADLVPTGCRCLADVGTDHGYIPAALLLEGRVERAVAADVGALPLEHARRTARRLGLDASIDFRLGDGLTVLSPGEADVTIIAGMGGDNIVSILSAAPWARKGLLLQPMSRAEVLRRWLTENGYAVEAERLVQDKGVIYPILTVESGDVPPASPAEAWGGFLLAHDPLWGAYLEERILRLRKAAAGLARARDPALACRQAEFLRIAEELETRREEWTRANRTGD